MMSKKMTGLTISRLSAVFALSAVVLCGCDKQTAPELEEVYPAEGNAYMHDSEFRAQLETKGRAKGELQKALFKMNDELKALLKENGGDIAAVTGTVCGAELVGKIRQNEALLVSNRMETARLVRERAKRAQADSLRIERGEAKAIDISKKESK